MVEAKFISRDTREKVNDSEKSESKLAGRKIIRHVTCTEMPNIGKCSANENKENH